MKKTLNKEGVPVDIQGSDTKETPTAEAVTVVVEYDLDRADLQLLKDLPNLFPPAETKISLVHVRSDFMPPTTDLEAGEGILLPISPIVGSQQYEARDVLEKIGYTLRDERICGVREHHIEQLLQYVEDNEQDLLVVCSKRENGKMVIRSPFSTHLALYARIPVLLMRKPFLRKNGTLDVLFGVDSSASTMTAVQKLSRLIQPESMALTLALIQSPLYQENAVLTPYVNQQALDEALEINANMVFEMVSDVLEVQGIQPQAKKRLLGSPASELGYLAELDNPDLMIVGSHNRRGFLAWLTGSVSSQLVNWGTHNLLISR